MIPLEDNEFLQELRHFYHKLERVLATEHIKKINGSILLAFLKIPQNRISKILSLSTLNKSSFPISKTQDLTEKGFIIESLDPENKQGLIITARGLWFLETQTGKLSIAQLIDFLQVTKFSTSVSEKQTTNVEKIILLSMISMRNFSIDTAMDLNSNDKSDHWQEIFQTVAEHLYSINCIGKLEWLPSKAGHEQPVKYLMRRAQDLPQKTKHIYVATGNYRYFLNINTPSEETRTKLQFLISAIYAKFDTKSDVNREYSFLCNLAYDHGKNVLSNLDLINPEWDSIIGEALNNYYYN